MHMILLDKVTNLGGLGDQVNVKSGYARNYLIPQGKAVPATNTNIKYFAMRRTELETKLTNNLAAAVERADKINELGSITIASKAGNKGKLFGSIGTRDIAEAITNAGINIHKKEVRLINGVLRTTGNHDVRIQVHNKICTNLQVLIVPEG